MVPQGGNTKECRGEEGLQSGAKVAKGRRTPLDPFIWNECGPIVASTSALTTSHGFHDPNAWQLTHCPKRFPLLTKIEASWEDIGVNARLFESAIHSSVFSLACQICAASLVTSSVTGLVVGLARHVWPYPGNLGAALPGHGRGLLSMLWTRGVPALGPLHEARR
jgi:hypothetical protein